MPDQDRTRQLLDYYYQERIKKQLDYYRRGSESYKKQDRLLRVSAGFLMLLIGLISALAAIFRPESNEGAQSVINIVLLLLPMASTALITLRNVFSFERLNRLYSRVRSDLSGLSNEYTEIVRAAGPEAKLADYIVHTEQILGDENIEWLEGWANVQTVEAATVTGRPDGGGLQQR